MFLRYFLSFWLFFTGSLLAFQCDNESIQAFELIEEEPSLISLILRADPFLANCQNHLEIARKLFPIVYDITVASFYNPTNVDHNSTTAQKYYEKVIRKFDPTQCGGSNTFFSKILNEYFNVPAFTINMGLLSTFHTHVATIVPIQEAKYRWRFYLFDTFYGAYYTDVDGELLDLESIFKRTPFIVKFPNILKKIVIDVDGEHGYEDVSEIIYNPIYYFMKQIDDSRFLCSFPAIYNTQNYPYRDCIWEETLELHYLAVGGLINIPNSHGKISRYFHQLMKQFKINNNYNKL